MQIATENLSSPDRMAHKLLYAAITPRPIAWISTVDAQGNSNLAPFSFFNAVCSFPPTIMFSISYRAEPAPKDTLTNIRETGEFVVNFVTESNARAMNITAADFPYGVSEIERAGLTAIPSTLVKAPRIQESPIHFECKLNQIVTISEQPGGAYVIIGNVVYMHAEDAIYNQEKDYIDFDAYQVVGRMAGNGYTTTRERFDLIRPKMDLK